MSRELDNKIDKREFEPQFRYYVDFEPITFDKVWTLLSLQPGIE